MRLFGWFRRAEPKTFDDFLRGDLDLSGANLGSARFADVQIPDNTVFDGADMTGASFIGTTVPATASMVNVTLEGATLGAEADFSGVNLSGSKSSGAGTRILDARGATLTGTNLERAQHPNALLENANLRGANCSGADFHGANFTGADCTGADFRGADLSGAKLVGTDLSGVFVDADTRLPGHLLANMRLFGREPTLVTQDSTIRQFPPGAIVPSYMEVLERNDQLDAAREQGRLLEDSARQSFAASFDNETHMLFVDRKTGAQLLIPLDPSGTMAMSPGNGEPFTVVSAQDAFRDGRGYLRTFYEGDNEYVVRFADDGRTVHMSDVDEIEEPILYEAQTIEGRVDVIGPIAETQPRVLVGKLSAQDGGLHLVITRNRAGLGASYRIFLATDPNGPWEQLTGGIFHTYYRDPRNPLPDYDSSHGNLRRSDPSWTSPDGTTVQLKPDLTLVMEGSSPDASASTSPSMRVSLF